MSHKALRQIVRWRNSDEEQVIEDLSVPQIVKLLLYINDKTDAGQKWIMLLINELYYRKANYSRLLSDDDTIKALNIKKLEALAANDSTGRSRNRVFDAPY